MSAETVRQHAFSPSADGGICGEMQYPAYRRCGKGPRSKVHSGARPEPPELEYPYPPCSLCGEDTYHDGDSLRCAPCGAHWGDRGGPGSWDDDLNACGAMRKPFDRPGLDPKYEDIRHHRDYCIREDGHEGKHRADQFSEWSS